MVLARFLGRALGIKLALHLFQDLVGRQIVDDRHHVVDPWLSEALDVFVPEGGVVLYEFLDKLLVVLALELLLAIVSKIVLEEQQTVVNKIVLGQEKGVLRELLLQEDAVLLADVDLPLELDEILVLEDGPPDLLLGEDRLAVEHSPALHRALHIVPPEQVLVREGAEVLLDIELELAHALRPNIIDSVDLIDKRVRVLR